MDSILHDMCGRFTLHHSTEDVAERFAVEQTLLELKPRFNIAPSQPHSKNKKLIQLTQHPAWSDQPVLDPRVVAIRVGKGH